MNQPTQTFNGQASTFRALAALVSEHPNLPAPYIVVHADGRGANVQVHRPADFEAWREALSVPASSVELRTFRADSWLQADAEFGGVVLHLAGFGVEVPTPALAVAS